MSASVDTPAGERPGGWGVIVSYALVAAATQMLWLTYAAITTNTDVCLTQSHRSRS